MSTMQIHYHKKAEDHSWSQQTYFYLPHYWVSHVSAFVVRAHEAVQKLTPFPRNVSLALTSAAPVHAVYTNDRKKQTTFFLKLKKN